MAEEKNGKIVSTGKTTCACGTGCTCGCGHYYAHRALWWILGIVILGIVFCIGVKAGEFRDELHSLYGGYYRGYPMMQEHVYNGAGVAVPAAGGAQGSATGTTGEAPMIPAQQ
jgi:hypothetical protein